MSDEAKWAGGEFHTLLLPEEGEEIIENQNAKERRSRE